MDKQAVFEVIVHHLRDVIPEVGEREITYADSLRELGANSVDRSEIIMAAREDLSLDMSLVAFAKAESIGELAEIMVGGLARA